LTQSTTTAQSAHRPAATPARLNPTAVPITGATGGIGGALARSYAQPGPTLVPHGRDELRLAALAGDALAAFVGRPQVGDRSATGATRAKSWTQWSRLKLAFQKRWPRAGFSHWLSADVRYREPTPV